MIITVTAFGAPEVVTRARFSSYVSLLATAESRPCWATDERLHVDVATRTFRVSTPDDTGRQQRYLDVLAWARSQVLEVWADREAVLRYRAD